MTDKERIIEGVDKDEKSIKVMLRMPSASEYRDSQVAYNKAFRMALDSGALLRQKLSDYMREQGIWNEEKQNTNDRYVEEISAMEEQLKTGGIRLSEAKEIALQLRDKRLEFREFLAERNTLDQNSAEGQADNARFSELIRMCTLNPSTRQPFFPTQADYDKSADQPWVVEAASELANMIYGLDPNYDKKLEENKFLKEFNFVNEDLRFVDEDGHLTDAEGRLINEDGRFVAYKTEEGKKKQDADEVHFVNRNGEEVVSVTDDSGEESWVKASAKERKPFLDDDGEPLAADKKEEKEEKQEVSASTKPKRKRKSTKTEKDAETS